MNFALLLLGAGGGREAKWFIYVKMKVRRGRASNMVAGRSYRVRSLDFKKPTLFTYALKYPRVRYACLLIL